jgi:subtilisin-like proprotein convertase family protein
VTDGVGSCQAETWCAPVTVDADCALLPHIAIPGSWSCSLESTCVWHGSMPPRTFTNETVVAIPDNNAVGITSTIEVADTGACQKSIMVSASITHTYIGDLVVGVTDPNGVRIVMHDRAGGSTDNLSIGNMDLSNLVGVATANGTWTLDVHDRAAADTGTLQNWSITIGCR